MFVEHFRELYRHRVLIESLVWREVKARYRGSALGFLWTLLNPLLLLLVYSLVFSVYMRSVSVSHYPVFLFVGLLPWLWLSSAIVNGSTSIAKGGALITRVCIPPQVLPAVAVLSNFVNFLLALPIAVGAAAVAGMVPTAALALLPFVLFIELVFLYGVVVMVAALTVRFRDVEFLVQNVLTFWFFLTPIVYSMKDVPARYHALVLANPATALLLPFQEIIYYRTTPSLLVLGLAAGWATSLVVIGVRVFESMRDTLAEEI